MKQICYDCGSSISSEYCCNCGTENGVPTAKDEAYAEYLELVEEGSKLTEARREDCLRNGSERFQEWTKKDEKNTRQIQAALNKYISLCV
jgi:hypothetical protein